MWESKLGTSKLEFQSINLNKLRHVFPNLNFNIEQLEKIQDHSYQDKSIAAMALLHRSALVHWPNDKTGICSNERLEFLGDAFLNFYVAFETMLLQPNLNEGELSKLRSIIVGTENLALKSVEIGLSECLLLGKTEANAIHQNQTSVLPDAFEAVTAALLIDGGEQKVKKWLDSVFAKDLRIDQESVLNFDAKGRVQQWVQSIINMPPAYHTVSTEGANHTELFTVAGFIGNKEFARATARNKRLASKMVAKIMLSMIESGTITREEVMNCMPRADDKTIHVKSAAHPK